MSERQRHVKEPTRGPWRWQDYLPRCDHELDDLRVRAAVANPGGIHLGRWLRWVEAERLGTSGVDIVRGSNALAKYRRFLYELNVDHQPTCGCGEAPRIHASVAFCRPSGVAA